MDINMNCYGEELLLDTMTEMIKLRAECERTMAPITQKHGISPVQAVALHLISVAESSTVGTVFKSLNLNQGNVSSMCKKLETDGFLERHRADTDERRVVLSLTEKGERTLSSIKEEICSVLAAVSCITTEDLEAMYQSLKTICEITAKANKIISECKGNTKNA